MQGMILVRHLLLQHLGPRFHYCHPLVAISCYYFGQAIILIVAQHLVIIVALIEPLLVAHLVVIELPEKQQWRSVWQRLHPRHQLRTRNLRPFPHSCHMQSRPQQLSVLRIQERWVCWWLPSPQERLKSNLGVVAIVVTTIAYLQPLDHVPLSSA